MYIRNGQSISKSGFDNISRKRDISDIADISEMKPTKRTEPTSDPICEAKGNIPSTFQKSHDNDDSYNSNNNGITATASSSDASENLRNLDNSENFGKFDVTMSDIPESRYERRKKARLKKNQRYNTESAAVVGVGAGRIAEYLYSRKYYILLFSVLYIAGLIVGAILVKSVGSDRIAELRNAVDDYFVNVSSSNIPMRILNSASVDGAIIFIAYLSGVTVFAPLVCSAICLYKGLACGYIIGVYISGGADLFHLAVCCLTFVFYILVMLCFILMCAESMSFSAFLIKSGESFRVNLSLRNIAVYSARYALFLILTLIFVTAQAIVLPLIYSAYY